MTDIKVSVILCTVRDSQAYSQRPEWDVLDKVVDDLALQVDAPPFELIIVDGLLGKRRRREDDVSFPICHVPPRIGSPWVRMRKVAISAYRNAGIATARGELCLNCDDCAVLPPNFVNTFWRAWNEQHIALAMSWPNRGDRRPLGRVTRPGTVHGFGSYPRELALQLNGYDEAYDGGQGLEDMDWSWRLHMAGLQQALVPLPGFDIADQTAHSREAIDLERPVVKCCNQAWQSVRMRRDIRVANLAENWPRQELERLVGPCPFLHGTRCGHHEDRNPCAYLEAGFADRLDPQAAAIFDEPPVLSLRALSEASR